MGVSIIEAQRLWYNPIENYIMPILVRRRLHNVKQGHGGRDKFIQICSVLLYFVISQTCHGYAMICLNEYISQYEKDSLWRHSAVGAVKTGARITVTWYDCVSKTID